MAVRDLTIERLKELLHYDPETGLFTWKSNRPSHKSRAKAGAVAGHDNGNGYLAIGIDGDCFYSHRLAWFYMTERWPKHYIDHADRDRKNNKWSNLRPANNKQNQENRVVRHDSMSGAKGVDQLPGGRWRAKIRHDWKMMHIGVFDTKEEAIAARAGAEAVLFTHGVSPLPVSYPDDDAPPDATE